MTSAVSPDANDLEVHGVSIVYSLHVANLI